jgi:pimeloyl-ACP methyl ester carboxylesterase
MIQRILFSLFGLTLAALLVLLPDVFQPRDVAPASWALGRGPTVVLVHGLGSRVDHWLPVARRLATRHRVVLVELPGHGLSPMPPPFTLEQATAALDASLRSAAPEPFVLVGHSIGGQVAVDYALRHPGRVRGLVLVETALRPGFDEEEQRGIRAALDADWEGTVRDVWSSFGRDSVQGAALHAAAASVDPATLRAWIEIALETDLSLEASRLHVPVHVVLADRNWARGMTWPVVAVEMGYERVNRVTAERLDRCGHFVMLDRPAELARTIAAATASAPIKPAPAPIGPVAAR